MNRPSLPPTRNSPPISATVPYLSRVALETAQANDRKRQEAYDNLIKVHDTVTTYMITLTALTGEKTFDLSPGIGSVSGQIQAHSELGLESKYVSALADIAKLVAKQITSYNQQDAVKNLIRAGESPLQTSLDGMASLLRIYRKIHENERRQVLGLCDTEFALAKVAAKDPLLMALARVHYQEKNHSTRARSLIRRP